MADLLTSQVIREAVIALYVKVLDFLAFSTQWMKKSSISECFKISVIIDNG